MKYIKKPLSIEQQLEKLISRGLVIEDKSSAKHYLSNISYYRLRAYTFPFQDNNNSDRDHSFLRDDISFSDIIDLYCFDRRLRTLLFNAIEKIEVAVRTKIIQTYAEATKDSHWFLDITHFEDKKGNTIEKYDALINDISSEIKRSNEDFIKHYKGRYTEPLLPPSWMTLEVLSLGTLSRLFSLLRESELKKKVAESFGIKDSVFFVNWLHSISVLRNCCAHHSRVWNRRYMVNVRLSYNTIYPFVRKADINAIRNNKLFVIICCIKYITDIISPDSNFRNNLFSLLKEGGRLLQLKDMGFPNNWKDLDIWK